MKFVNITKIYRLIANYCYIINKIIYYNNLFYKFFFKSTTGMSYVMKYLCVNEISLLSNYNTTYYIYWV
jgi:hypothetical protein